MLEGEEELDREETGFGIRTLSIDAAHGVRINGQTVKLRGACIHHDNGILGAATLPDAEERRIRQLKEAGFNAIRSSHHPAGRALLDACDRYGVLVMDELSDVWNVRKNPYDYALYFEQDWKPTIQKMVAKDYNHPSVILYCVGNEISEAGSESGAETNRRLCNTFRELDPTRYTTNALNGLMAAGYRLREIMGDVMRKFPAQPGPSGGDGGGSNALNSFMSLMSGEKGDYFATHPLLTEALSGCEDSCDVIGLNYLTGRHVLEHELHPHKAVLGTETYPADIVRLWRIVEENPHMIGDFTWAGYDYLGRQAAASSITMVVPTSAAFTRNALPTLEIWICWATAAPSAICGRSFTVCGRHPIWQCCEWNTTVRPPAKRLGCSRITFPVGHGPVLRDRRLRWMCTPPRRRWSCS